MRPRAHRRRLVACLILSALVARPAPAQQTPRFQSSVEVTSIDVTVVDNDGRPVTSLAPADFAVRVNGSGRRVISAEWVPLAAAPGPPPAPLPEGYSSNQGTTGGRLILIAVDEGNIRFGDAGAILRTAGGFVDRLQPSDRVAVVSLGRTGSGTPFTPDHELVKRALSRMAGEPARTFGHNIAVSEALDIAAEPSNGAGFVSGRVAARECGGLSGFELDSCREELWNEAKAIEQEARINASQTLRALGDVLDAVKAIDAPKTIVLVSGGFVMSDLQPEVLDVARRAADARTSLYVLASNDFMGDIGSATGGISPVADRALRSEGLDLLASASRGSLFNVVGNGNAAFAQIESEISGYYLVGIESDPSDKDGKAHPIDVSVGRKGLTVRSRRQLLSKSDPSPRSPRDSVMAALNLPLLLSALPLRVATFSVREPETTKVQLLIHVDVGADYSSAKSTSLGYVISDPNGRIVDSVIEEARLPPVMNGVPSPLQFRSSASLEPGEYTLKLSVVEGDRVGSIEHAVHAGLVPAGSNSLSELMVGGPVSTGELDRSKPTLGPTVHFGTVHGYIEAYGAGSDQLSVNYQVSADEDSVPLVEAAARAATAGNERTIYSEMIPVARLPPGRYILRATVSSGGLPVKTMARSFEVAPPAVLMTSAESIGTLASAPAEIYLPVADELFSRPFRREDATHGDTLRIFRESVTPESRTAFDKGVSSLSAGDFPDAEQSFKSALRVDDQSSVALAYLGATYAASGHDTEASGAWQTSLVDGSDFPQIYEWLGDTLIRLHDLAQAKTILEEAAKKWPADLRFVKPLALVYASFGQGREAVRLLERHLAAHPDDREALSLGVEWIYHLHSAGAVAHAPTDDVKLAREWANVYTKAKGPQTALVRQWMQALDAKP